LKVIPMQKFFKRLLVSSALSSIADATNWPASCLT
jgi:hypothetical protein